MHDDFSPSNRTDDDEMSRFSDEEDCAAGVMAAEACALLTSIDTMIPSSTIGESTMSELESICECNLMNAFTTTCAMVFSVVS